MAKEEAEEAKSVDRRLAYIAQQVQKSFRIKLEKWQKFLCADEKTIKIITEFFSAGSTVPNLFFVLSTGGLLSLSTNVIGNTKGLSKIVFFRNCNPNFALLPDTPTKELQRQIFYAELPPNVLSFCITALKEISVPVLENDRNQLEWSQLIRDDISQQLGRISRDASILEAKTHGRTLLPFPQRPAGLGEQVKPEFWTLDWKEIAETNYGRQLVYAVETVVIEWSHQVETLLGQDSAQPLLRGEHATPRTEVAFWRQMFTSVEFVYDQMMQEKARRMGQLLESANSAYSRSFKKVFVDVVKEAQDISTHLQPLGQYVEDFENIDFDESEKLLPPMWHLICLIWSHSQFYRLPARVILLIRELCNLVIQQAQQFLPADEVFKGEAEEVLPKVCTCLRILDAFWQQYLLHRDQLPQYFEKSGSQPVLLWRFSHSMAFSRFDAFRARLEQIRLVLATWLEFAKLEKVEFGGWKGNLLSDQLRTVAGDFQQSYQLLSEPKYNCMDPADEGFQADYDFLMGNVMELYRRLATIYSIAFHDCSGLEAIFKLAAVYSTLKAQPFIQEAIAESFADILSKIDAELETCKAIYDGQLRHRAEHGRYAVHRNLPQVAGALKWSTELRRRIKRPIEELRFLDKGSLDTEKGQIVLKKKDELLNYLDDFDRSLVKEWQDRIDSECEMNLRHCLLAREAESNYLEVNFDPKLVAALSEVKYIRLLNGGSSQPAAEGDSTATLNSVATAIEVPTGAEALYAQRETLRVYYTNLYNTVRWYNYLLDSVLHYERALLADRMQAIESLAEQGLTSVTWESPDALAYIEQLRDLVHATYRVIVQAHANTDRLQAAVRGLAARPVFERTPEKYETLLKCDDREETTAARYRQVDEVGREVHKLVQENQQLFECEADSDVWRIYLETLDQIVLDGLIEVVTASLNYLLKHTESRSDQQPLFEIKMELDTERAQIEFRKSLDRNSADSFYDLVDTLLGDIFRQGRFIARVAGHFAEQSPDFRNYQADLESHELLNDLRTSLVEKHVAPATAQALKYRESFRKHASLWTDDRQEFLRQFLLYSHTPSAEEVEQGVVEESPPTLPQFREQIDRFEEIYNEVAETEPHVVFDGWLRLDVRPFKQALLNTVRKWSHLLKDHLVNHVINSLSDLDSFIQETKEILAIEPQPGDYHQLVAVMARLAAQKERQAQTDAMFEPLQQTIELLKEYGQEMPPEVHDQLEVLPESWSNCKKMAAQMRTGLLPLQNQQVSRISAEASEFDQSQRALQEAFRCCAAFQRTCSDPYAEIDAWNSRLSESEAKAAELVESGRLFEVNIPDFKLIRLCRKELLLLKSLWDLLFTIRFNIEAWQETPWMQVDVDMMDLECKNFAKLLRQLDSAVRAWDAYAGGETDVKNMLTSLRAVTELRNPAIRDRHWAALMQATGVRFTMSESTTLHQLLQLELHRYEEDVRNIVDKAVKEMAMEKTLKEIEVNWTTMELEHERHPRTGITIVKASDEVIETLEDNQAQLQNMLTNKHVAYFLDQVRDWVRRLATADQVLAIYLEVQRTWINLESIFIGSEDIREQLPESSQRFDAIDKDFKDIVTTVERYTNVVASTNQDGLYDRLEKVQQDLSVCEKALMDYMETKRLAFPRFYFVSHNDLLDILSHGNEPVLVMKHLTKLFDSMAKLRFVEDGEGQTTKTANAMWSKDGEFVKLCSQPTLEGQVEMWLSVLLKEMRDTMRHTLSDAVANFEEKPRDQWIFDYPAQVALSGSQIGWTVETNLAFSRLEEGFENALKEFNKKQIANLNALISLLIGELSAQDRQKIMTICTIDVHNRDIVGKLIAQKVENSQAFTWLSQLRHRWDEQQGDCFANICDAEFRYYHEYLGNTPRLVITPLTDRCYITLTQSLHLYMSGAPAGPAGTGKTETTKDLGRALGMMVYVFNCSEQMDYRSIGNIYKGLAQSGAWGCFDEFNRIAVEVLSVVAVQVKCIQDALKALAASQPEQQPLQEGGRFRFLGEEISLSTSVGIFITMNPGYAGRTELPENLKALFRPCAMVVPDFDLICEIMLVAEGFLEARLLAKKFITLYELCKELLSKQDHYDWGLRAIKSVLVVAGSLKRSDPSRPENQVLMRALRDFNIPKIVTDDVPVFMGLIRDLFPALDVPRKRDMDFEKQVRQAALDLHLQPEDNFILKVVQLQELFAVRHSVFINGFAGTGKSEVWKTLHRTYQNQKKKAMSLDLNPKAVTNDELFGVINSATREWRDGIFSVVMRDLANVPHDGPKWIVLDGDIDPMWIESLNTVMDDNKVLTLASNERIPLTPSMRLLFEISHLRTATPATVSRAGILYINPGDLGWLPFVTSWINARGGQTEQANLTVLFDKYVPPCLDVLKSKFKKVTPIPEISHVQMLCCLLESIMTPENGITADATKDAMEPLFCFACIWAFGGCTFQDQLVDHRVEFSKWFLHEFKMPKLTKDYGVFDVYLDFETKRFEPWSKKVPNFELDPDVPLQSTLVHTAETVRVKYLLDLLLAKRYPVMLVGNAGTGKSVLMQEKLQELVETTDNFTVANVPFNFYTTSEMLQRVLERPLEKKSGKNYGPPGTRRLIYFVDDMNMPEVDKYFTVQPHALIRQHMDYGHWYDRQKISLKEVHNTQYVACMNPTAGSFRINPRLQRHFAVLAMSLPGHDALETIYTSILSQHLGENFPAEVRRLQTVKDVVHATLSLHQRMLQNFLPTAVKFHYLFNLRDLSAVFQGMLFAEPDCLKGRLDLIRLWMHECERVYCDKLVDSEDIAKYQSISKDVAKKMLSDYITGSEEAAFRRPLLFCHFAKNMGDEKYQAVESLESIDHVLTEALESYNEINAAMNLVLFEDAISHVLRISRILESPRGNALLVGVGGSGKQSLSRLAAFLTSLEVFQISLRKGYGIADLRADLAQLYVRSGQKGIRTMFYLLTVRLRKRISLCWLMTCSHLAKFQTFLLTTNWKRFLTL
ncbi:hypothetical protein BOX15_Mlig034196g2 [Macrostomum lignano]|uniref:AAA+ ATPase domain-containing protein n=1 Tax=Macrostomum lignano TaxID=282301 RepID=A0A267E7P3_9PLAT|nr:hypothetical protein BOX15_Mlig034196g2 [Macrostomum lignano]